MDRTTAQSDGGGVGRLQVVRHYIEGRQIMKDVDIEYFHVNMSGD